MGLGGESSESAVKGESPPVGSSSLARREGRSASSGTRWAVGSSRGAEGTLTALRLAGMVLAASTGGERAAQEKRWMGAASKRTFSLDSSLHRRAVEESTVGMVPHRKTEAGRDGRVLVGLDPSEVGSPPKRADAFPGRRRR